MKTNTQNTNSGLKNRSEQLSTAKEGAANAAAPTERKVHRLPVDYDQRRQNRTLPAPQVLNLLVTKPPDAYRLAEVVGKWVWVQFQDIPAAEIRQQLSQLGFHWNRARQAWQHPCGLYRDVAATVDPHQKYGSYFAADLNPA
jgi:hypothetical protein